MQVVQMRAVEPDPIHDQDGTVEALRHLFSRKFLDLLMYRDCCTTPLLCVLCKKKPRVADTQSVGNEANEDFVFFGFDQW